MDEQLEVLEEIYQELVVERQCALRNVRARIENIRDTVEFERKSDEGLKENSPFDTIKDRIKTFESAYDKLSRRGWDKSYAGFEQMKDIAGIRIITPFLSDVYEIRDILRAQIEKTKPKNAMRIVEEEDYIVKPKKNGYRSLHLLVETKVSAVKGDKAKWIPVEIQIRTKAMDLWASIEHRLKYKNPHPSRDTEEKLSDVADYLCGFDDMIMLLRDENDEEALGIEDVLDTLDVEEILQPKN